MQPGFRRRILIEPGPDATTAELEDDYHRMVVTLRHAGGIVTAVESGMKRAPWTGCRGATDELARTFSGVALADAGRRGAARQNCTHLHDLALFAAGHAAGTRPVTYDIHVTDPVAGRREARLARDGTPLLHWTLEDGRLVSPPAIAGRGLREISGWIAEQEGSMSEAARILRWAALIAHGRELTIPAGSSATAFPSGACYNFQPERQVASTRSPGADVDFSLPGAEPMADRSQSFGKPASRAA